MPAALDVRNSLQNQSVPSSTPSTLTPSSATGRSMDPALGQIHVQVQISLETDDQGVVESTYTEHIVAKRHGVHSPKVVESADQDGVEPEGEDGARWQITLLNSCLAPDVEVPVGVPSSVP
eukprot:3919606-Rhodomonas_salina.1